jgi:hypothetical protein
MTEWNTSEYARISTLQAAMATEVLALLDLAFATDVLDRYRQVACDSPGEENSSASIRWMSLSPHASQGQEVPI